MSTSTVVLHALCVLVVAVFTQAKGTAYASEWLVDQTPKGAYAASEGEITEEHKQMAKMLHSNCVKESGVNEDYITGASKGNFENDSNLKCYMKCLLVEMGVLSEDDLSIDREAFIEMAPEEIKGAMVKALDKCLPLVGEDPCEMAFNLNKCFYGFDPDKYMIV